MKKKMEPAATLLATFVVSLTASASRYGAKKMKQYPNINVL
jgi:hypothetical protein